MNSTVDKENGPDLEAMVRRIVREEISECGCLCGEGKVVLDAAAFDVCIQSGVNFERITIEPKSAKVPMSNLRTQGVSDKALKSSLSQILDVMVRERVHLTFASLQRR
jgi:hypothetical protein